LFFTRKDEPGDDNDDDDDDEFTYNISNQMIFPQISPAGDSSSTIRTFFAALLDASLDTSITEVM